MSDDLVEWLRAQFDDDERLALAWPADQRSWDEYGDRRLDYASGAGEEVSAVNVKASAVLGWERIYVKRDGIGLSRHIVRHDPARVLCDIDARRQIVERYAWLREHGDTGGMAWVLPLLALPYADRPGYREEWRP